MSLKFFNVNSMKNYDRVTSFTKFGIYHIFPEVNLSGFPLHFSIYEIYTPADSFRGTCSLIRRACQRTLNEVDLRIHARGFFCQQRLWSYVPFSLNDYKVVSHLA